MIQSNLARVSHGGPDISDLSGIQGLSSKEAEERLLADGYNELPSAAKRRNLEIVLEILREPMLLLLVACGSIYFMLGDKREAAVLLLFVFVVIGITIYQERKTERALDALRDLSSPRALVIRDGEKIRIPGREVVVGDLLVLAEGDRVPADSILLSCVNLFVDESLLTGESVPVQKSWCPDAQCMERPGGEASPFAYSGTMVVQGRGIGRVMATGIHTEMGRIGKALERIEPEKTRLRLEIERIVRDISAAGLVLSLLVMLVYSVTGGGFLKGFLAGITLEMAILPEEFPVVLTIFLALGAWRISKKNVLTRRVPAVETLGSATVLCTDKTGTITLNRMAVRRIYADGKFYEIDHSKKEGLPDQVHEIVEFGILAGERDPFNPMEKALIELGRISLNNTEHIHDDWILVKEYPLSESMMAMSRVWRSKMSQDCFIAAKGSPEAISDLCHLDEERLLEIAQAVACMAGDGLRVLGVARAYLPRASLPGEQHDFKFELLGLLGFADPVRPAVPQAVRECSEAGIRVVMITGDHPATAGCIARQIGIASGQVVTGPELDGMAEQDLGESVRSATVFARTVPEQKLRLVNALKANGEIVAMTGDGVNDAPALKAAHIGIAMGGRGTDVARESAAMVLLDDDFSSIVQAVRMGRRIFDNIRKAMAYILAVHVPIAGMSLLPVIMGWPLALMPVHIAFLELIIDPACSVVFEAEAEEKNVMSRPPRDPEKPLFSRRATALALLQGLSVLIIVAFVFYRSLQAGLGDHEARAMAFTTLVVANLCLILTNRSWSGTILETLRTPNPALWIVFGGTLLLLGMGLYMPFIRDIFHFAFLHPDDLALCLVAGALSILWFEALKVLNGQRGSGDIV